MRGVIPLLVLGWIAATPYAMAQSVFNGTWRPDPQHPEPDRPPDVFQLMNGEYQCRSCRPPYKVKADGLDQPISGNARFDTLRITVIDEHTVAKAATRAGATVAESRAQVSPDGRTLTERQVLSNVGPRKVDFTSRSSRVSEGPQGSHAISGSWHLIEADLTNHDEDTDYLVSNGTLSMSDRLGRSFTARLDGSEAPYQGDPDFTSVSLRLIDERTIEESDKKAGKVVKVTRWRVDPDGNTMHARFDDLQGHVQEQTGHKISR